MFHNQVQQVQQRVNSMQQIANQMRQAEQNNQQRLQQITQEENNVIQQLNQVQQICQECLSTLQNVGFTQTQYGTGATQTPIYQGTAGLSNFGATQYGSQGQLATTSPLFDPATMGASTYQGTMQNFGHIPGSTGTGLGQFQQAGTQFTTSPLSDIATMGPDTYQASQQRLGGAATSLSQIGQQAGISSISGSSSF